MPELGTCPGPHVPLPFEVRSIRSDDRQRAAREIFDLIRVNWDSADMRSKWPVTLSYARRVGGILDEFGDADTPESSFRYFI